MAIAIGWSAVQGIVELMLTLSSIPFVGMVTGYERVHQKPVVVFMTQPDDL